MFGFLLPERLPSVEQNSPFIEFVAVSVQEMKRAVGSTVPQVQQRACVWLYLSPCLLGSSAPADPENALQSELCMICQRISGWNAVDVYWLANKL